MRNAVTAVAFGIGSMQLPATVAFKVSVIHAMVCVGNRGKGGQHVTTGGYETLTEYDYPPPQRPELRTPTNLS